MKKYKTDVILRKFIISILFYLQQKLVEKLVISKMQFGEFFFNEFVDVDLSFVRWALFEIYFEVVKCHVEQ